MRAHIVLAHPEPKSFNAHMAATAAESLRKRGATVTLSDLHGMGFDPLEHAGHYPTRAIPERFDAQAEQKRASEAGDLPAHVRSEIEHLDAADLVILQYPMWWHLPPAMLKGWFDRVFAYGEVYTSKKRFEAGRFEGRRAILSVTVATSAATYAHDGRSGDIDLLLWPVNFSLAYVGFTVLEPFVGYGIESALRYSSAQEVDARLARVTEDWARTLEEIENRKSIPFNRMAEWGSDGHLKPDASLHSPFMRRKRVLELE